MRGLVLTLQKEEDGKRPVALLECSDGDAHEEQTREEEDR